MSEEQETLGSYLRRERKKRDVSIEQIAYATRISLKMLNALEEDQHQQLPAQPFVRGYLQAYAKYVSLDPKDVLLRYQHHLATQPTQITWASRANIEEEETGASEKRKLVWITAGLLVLLAGSGTYFWLKGRLQEENAKAMNRAPVLKNASVTKADGTVVNAADPAAAVGLDALTAKTDGGKTQDPLSDLAKAPVAPAKPAEAKTTEPPVSTTAAATAKPETKAPAPEVKPAASPEPAKVPETTAEVVNAADTEPKKYNLTLTAKEDVWLRFQTDKDEVKDLILRRNKAITIRANKVIRMFSGNVKAMNGSLNGQPLDTLTQGDWKRSVVIPFSEIPNVSLPLFPGAGEGDSRSTAKKDDSSANTSTE